MTYDELLKDVRRLEWRIDELESLLRRYQRGLELLGIDVADFQEKYVQ